MSMSFYKVNIKAFTTEFQNKSFRAHACFLPVPDLAGEGGRCEVEPSCRHHNADTNSHQLLHDTLVQRSKFKAHRNPSCLLRIQTLSLDPRQPLCHGGQKNTNLRDREPQEMGRGTVMIAQVLQSVANTSVHNPVSYLLN